MKKTAVILFNLGGPNSTDEVRTFLFRLFYDKAILNFPNPFRWLLAQFLSRFREKEAKKIYTALGGKSPILSETISQKVSLENAINDKNVKVFVSMRYSYPDSLDTIKKVKDFDPQEIILLPLYPQFSTTTSKSSIEDFIDQIKREKIKSKVKTLCCYPTDKLFIESHADKIKEVMKSTKSKNFRILFSAHSLPEKIIKMGDPYQWQIEQSVDCITKKLGIKNLDYKITYQSKVTPVKWLEPSTEKEIEKAGYEVESVIVVPIAFVSEHSETLVELDIEYKEIADKKNLQYLRVPTLGIDTKFISSLSNMIKSLMLEEKSLVYSDKKSRICPNKFTGCICKDF